MTHTDVMTMAQPPLVSQPWSWRDFFSERMIFGLLIIIGFITLMHELIYEGATLRPEIISIVSSGVGALGAAIGVIVAAIWKSDKADKQAAATMASLANTVAAQVPAVTTVTTETPAPANTVVTTETKTP